MKRCRKIVVQRICYSLLSTVVINTMRKSDLELKLFIWLTGYTPSFKNTKQELKTQAEAWR